MIKRVINYIQTTRHLQRVNLGLSRAATTSFLRQLDETLPTSWEFSGFSQNGEDGIIDFLLQKLIRQNRYFVEIGAADGLENNSAWLAIGKKYSGLMIEGCPKLVKRLNKTMSAYNIGVEALASFVTKENCTTLLKKMLHQDPDLFSLDIDGNDYYILQALLENGFKPKIIAVEYNSAYGPEQAITIPYQNDFHYLSMHASGLYYGVSIQAWHKLLNRYDYQFVTVDSNGVNAFYVSPNHYKTAFLQAIQPLPFAENFYQVQKYKTAWPEQFKLIEKMPFEVIT
jgi:hypothetical protein